MGGILVSKSLIQFSVDGRSCVPFLLFTWGQTLLEVMQIMVISFKRSHECTATLSAPSPAAGHHQAMPLLETPRHSQASLGQTSVASLFLSPGSWCTRFCLCLRRVYFPACVSFGSSMVGLMATFSKGGLCHIHICCTQSHCPCGSPLLTSTSTGDAQTQFCLSWWGPWVLVHTRFV